MPLFLQIVDDNGNPDPVGSLADVIIDTLTPKKVGFFRTKAHVSKSVRDTINELIRAAVVIVVPAKVSQVCPICQKSVGVWHTYADGSITCTDVTCRK